MSPTTIIDHAIKDDVPHILAMIHELAAYEHATSSVEATLPTLTSSLCFAPTRGAAPSGPGHARTLLLRVPSSPSSPSSTQDSSAASAATASPHSYSDDASDGSSTEVVAMALYFFNYSTWRAAPGIYLEDLYVRPQFRQRGYGKLLIRALAAETVKVGGKRLEWSCLKWNEPSLAFYRGLGAQEMVEWVGLRVDGEALDKLAAS